MIDGALGAPEEHGAREAQPAGPGQPDKARPAPQVHKAHKDSVAMPAPPVRQGP